jgi:hypothetical protein
MYGFHRTQETLVAVLEQCWLRLKQELITLTKNGTKELEISVDEIPENFRNVL